MHHLSQIHHEVHPNGVESMNLQNVVFQVLQKVRILEFKGLTVIPEKGLKSFQALL